MIELLSIGDQPNVNKKRYLIDSSSELAQLDIEFGTMAYCIADKKWYICNGSGNYVEKPSGGGGGTSIQVEELSVSENGEYTAPSGTAYSPVVVSVPNTYEESDVGRVVVASGFGDYMLENQGGYPNDITENGTYDTTVYSTVTVDVPNTYAAGDEGKVVKNGALVAQTARPSNITENGTYDTTENNSVTVAVPKTNPTVATYSGTLAAPLGSDPALAQVGAALIRGAVSIGFRAHITVDMSALGGSSDEMMVLQLASKAGNTYLLTFGGSVITSGTLSDAKCATYAVAFNGSTTSVQAAYLLSGGTVTDISPYASALPTVVTYFKDGT